MKKLNFIVLLASAALFLASCNGSSSDDNTSEGNWVKVGDLPTSGRYYAVSFTVGDSLVFIGTGNDGNTADAPLSDFWRFDGGWRQVASMPAGKGRQEAVAFAIGGKGYVGTGTGNYIQNTNTYFNDFYSYDVAGDTWSPIADFPGARRARATAFAVNNKGYVLTGITDNSVYLQDMYSFNPATGTWSEEDALPNDSRVGATSFVFDNQGYVLGGATGGGTLSPYFFKFDPTDSKWTRLRQIFNQSDSSIDDDWTDIERVDGVAIVLGSNMYFMTGSASASGGSPKTSSWAWNPYNDTWDQRSDFSADNKTPRWGAVGFTVNGNGYVGTGWNGSFPAFNDINQYFPNEDLNSND